MMWIVQAYVNGAYKKWRKVRNERGITGMDAVERMMRLAGLSNVQTEYGAVKGGLRVEQIGGA
jgi:Zn-dependent membrane protease YugP